MRVGITGSQGFVGSNMRDELLRKHSNVDCFEEFDRRRHDLFRVESMKPFVEDKDVIVHLAGVNRASDSELVKVNTLGTLNLLEAIRKYSHVNSVRFIFASSLQIYGFSSSLKFFKESHLTKPTTMYGLSKKFAEEITEKYLNEHGLEALILRIASVYGPNCRPFYSSVISTFIFQILNNLPIRIFGTGKSSRDFIYVKDLAKILLKALELKTTVPVVNVCTGILVSVNELVAKLISLSDREYVTIYNEETKDDFLVGDPSLCQKLFGLEKMTTLEEGLREMLQWFTSSKASEAFASASEESCHQG